MTPRLRSSAMALGSIGLRQACALFARPQTPVGQRSLLYAYVEDAATVCICSPQLCAADWACRCYSTDFGTVILTLGFSSNASEIPMIRYPYNHHMCAHMSSKSPSRTVLVPNHCTFRRPLASGEGRRPRWRECRRDDGPDPTPTIVPVGSGRCRA